jgi:YD repeat-containing protein
MGYDHAGNLAWNDDGNRNHYSYSYDALNRRTQMTYPPDSAGQHRTEEYSYDTAGNLQTHTNRAGNIQSFLYDNRNRQVWFEWNDYLTSSQSTAYDPASRVTQISNWDATINNVYRDDNTLLSQEEWTADYSDNVHRTVTYDYDDDGNRSNIAYPSGKSYSYGYPHWVQRGRGECVSFL